MVEFGGLPDREQKLAKQNKKNPQDQGNPGICEAVGRSLRVPIGNTVQ